MISDLDLSLTPYSAAETRRFSEATTRPTKSDFRVE